MDQPFTAAELKEILTELISARRITAPQAEDRIRTRAQEHGTTVSEDLLPAQVLKEINKDLVQTIIEVLPELLAQNNQRLIAALKSK